MRPEKAWGRLEAGSRRPGLGNRIPTVCARETEKCGKFPCALKAPAPDVPVSGLRSPASAFTLLEVLVALAIFALAAVVLGATYVNALNAYEAATRRNEYGEDLRFVRAALLTETDREKAEAGVELDLGGGKRARWQADIAPTSTVDLFSVSWTCAITDPARREPHRVTQTFLLLRPTWSDPVERSVLLEEVRERIQQIRERAP
ncbi:MAG: prepilin-type N-terminal cleavage/methylation domain-containing protein [Opitutaceae bacterium]|nr:prepilin-type N-terminal cleavage/methylation domain-containing protein [Opitutaceae bacterium]